MRREKINNGDKIKINIPSHKPIQLIDHSIHKKMGYPKLRKYQDDVINFVLMALDDFDFILVEAPTGLGKSLINMQVIEQKLNEDYDDAYVTAPFLGLTDVYRNEYDLTEIRGRGNYTCLNQPEYNCDYGICQRFPKGKKFCEKRDKCLYDKAVSRASKQDIVLTNPAYLMRYMRSQGKNFGKRDIAIFDEGHGLGGIISSQLETTITKKDIIVSTGKSKLPKTTSFDFWDENMSRYSNPLDEKIRDMKEKMDDGDEFVKMNLSKEYHKLRSVRDKFRIAEYIVENRDWGIIEEVYGNRGRKTVGLKFSPITVSGLAKGMLESCAEKVIITSATLLGGDVPAHELGLSDEEYAYIRVNKSPFDKENRPIYAVNVGKMSYKYRKKTLPKVVSMTREIISHHKGEKGLIIPPSFWLGKNIYTGIKNIDIPIYYHEDDKDERFHAIDRFKDEEGGSILISTYVREGYDFADDSCRFLIVPKIPFGALSEKVKKRMRKSQVRWQEKHDCNPKLDDEGLCHNYRCGRSCKKWYRYDALTTLVQILGRAVRHPDDWAKMYVLDSGFRRFLSSCKNMTPKWFKEAVV